MKRLLLPALVFGIAATGCGWTGTSVPSGVKTPAGDEISRTCPPLIKDVADPTKVAELLNRDFDFRTEVPGPEDFGIPPEVMNPPDSPALLIPTAAPLGAQVSCCSDLSNQAMGDPNFGSFASEEQLNQMGRQCGFTADSIPEAYQIRLDYYATTPGAEEAYRREASVTGAPQVGDMGPFDARLLSSIGDERKLVRDQCYATIELNQCDGYILLFRRRNFIFVHRLLICVAAGNT